MLLPCCDKAARMLQELPNAVRLAAAKLVNHRVVEAGGCCRWTLWRLGTVPRALKVRLGLLEGFVCCHSQRELGHELAHPRKHRRLEDETLVESACL